MKLGKDFTNFMVKLLQFSDGDSSNIAARSQCFITVWPEFAAPVCDAKYRLTSFACYHKSISLERLNCNNWVLGKLNCRFLKVSKQ